MKSVFLSGNLIPSKTRWSANIILKRRPLEGDLVEI